MIAKIREIVKSIDKHIELEDGDDRYLLEQTKDKLNEWIIKYEDDGK